MKSNLDGKTLAQAVLIAVFAICGTSLGQAIIHVDAAQATDGDGASWETAFRSLHSALQAAAGGDEIWVAQGTYNPAPSGGSQLISFVVDRSLNIYGGFIGGETSLDERDPANHPAILSGDLNGDDESGHYSNNSRQIMYVSGNIDFRLDGVIIRGGHSASGMGASLGAGLMFNTVSAIIQNCSFEDNTAGSVGGALYGWANNLEILDCTFSNNSSGGFGGGVAIYAQSQVTIARCLFQGNTSQGAGGLGISGAGDSFSEFVSIDECDFIANETSLIGGGVSCDGVELIMTNCRFIRNVSGYWAAGMLVAGGQNEPAAIIRNCLFSHNRADGFGGGFYAFSPVNFFNCTFSRNCGSGVATFESEVNFQNSILWENTPEQIFDDLEGNPPLSGSRASSSVISANFCDIQGGWTGLGLNNIDVDPLFVQPSKDNLRLSFGSPCVNAGDNGAVPADLTEDFDGLPRIQDDVVDMGAFEGEYPLLPPGYWGGSVGPGETAILGDIGCALDFDDFVNTSMIIFQNTSNQVEDATVTISEGEDSRHSAAGGFSELGSVVTVTTSLSSGEFKSLILIPFNEQDLQGEDPLELDLTYFDFAKDDWLLAVEVNVQTSPSHEGPVGDRIVTVGSVFSWSQELGDHGVYWNPDTRSGVVWAQLDHAGEFGLGNALCAANIAPLSAPDDVVDVDDLIAVIGAWGSPGGPADFFPYGGDGIVDVLDLISLLAGWGDCP